MAKKSSKSPCGTSFHNTFIITTPQKLIEIFGEPQYGDNDGSDKTNFDWVCETEDGDVFTIYDWKYNRPLKMDELVDFHIGGKTGYITMTAQHEISKLL